MILVLFFLIFIGHSTVLSAKDAFQASGSSVTLSQCYEWAKAQNESLKIRAEDVEQSKARARAAIGSALPYISWKLSDTRQDPNGVDELERKGFSGFVEKEQVESKFSLEQPIFSGLKEISAWKGFKRESVRDALRFERSALELYRQIAVTFYEVLEQETNMENTRASLELAENRVKELEDFFSLGKARESEVFTAKAHAAALKADLDRAQGDLNSAREELSYLTGKNMAGVPLADQIANPPHFGLLEEAVKRAENRSDVRAQEEDVAAKRLRVRYERGGYWPNVDVTGNYYTERATFLDVVDWDVILTVEVPIYQGGGNAARVREAISAYRQAVLTRDMLKRNVLYSVRRIHGELSAAVQRTKSLEDAAAAAQKSYSALLKEYRLGLVTNLDVLQALDLLQTQKKDRDTARMEMKRIYVELNVALEGTP